MSEQHKGSSTDVARKSENVLKGHEKEFSSAPSIVGREAIVSETTRPKWMKDHYETALYERANEFADRIRTSPNDIRILIDIQGMGDDPRMKMSDALPIYEQKIDEMLNERVSELSEEATLAELRVFFDKINPAAIRKEKVENSIGRHTPFFVVYLASLVGAESFFLRDISHEEVEGRLANDSGSVRENIAHLKRHLISMKEGLRSNIADLAAIYEELQSGHHVIEAERYFLEILEQKVLGILSEAKESDERASLEGILAEVIERTNSLQIDEVLDLNFFAGARLLVTASQKQIRNMEEMVNRLSRSVLANYGLFVAGNKLRDAITSEQAMKRAIGTTIRDTARVVAETGDAVIERRTTGGADFKQIEEACMEVLGFYDRLLSADKEVIREGTLLRKKLSTLRKNLSKHGSDDVMPDKRTELVNGDLS